MTDATRRRLLQGALAAGPLVAGSLAAGPSAAASASASPSDGLEAMDATALAHAIRSRRITPLEAADAAIRRAEAVQPKLNFITTAAFDRARDKARRMSAAKARGPFYGVPFLVKDLNDVKGLPTFNGCRLTAGSGPQTAQSAYIDAFERAGLNIFGKTATPEFGLLPTTEPAAFGPTRNPWNLDHSTGGSSGGAAAAVAARVSPFAHASDGGGSIRIPASCCGLFGLKPSRGRLFQADPPDPGIDLSVSHCVSLTVRDSAALFAATEQHGPFPHPVGLVSGPSKRRLRVGLLLSGMNGVEPAPDVKRQVLKTADTLRGLGHDVRDTRWPFDTAQFAFDFLALWTKGAQEVRDAAVKAVGKAGLDKVLEPYTIGAAEVADSLGSAKFDQAVARLQRQSAVYAEWFANLDVILSPVLVTAPPRIGWFGPDIPFNEMQERLLRYVLYTPPLNVVGAPAMSVPAGLSDNGLPIGAHLFAKVGDDRTLFHLAYELEQAQPWIGLKPGVTA